MATFTRADIEEILALQRSFEGIGFFGSDSYSRIDQLAGNLPLVQREQFRLFAAICLYKIQIRRGRARGVDRLPSHVLDFQKRLLHDVAKLRPAEIRARLQEFSSKEFIQTLEMITQGCPELDDVLSLVKCAPTGPGYLAMLEEHPNPKVKIEPQFLHFLPKHFDRKLITEEEYSQVRLSS